MIPGKILAFLEDEGTVGVSGTRDANLIPHIHYVSGWSVEPDRRTIRCSIAQGYTTPLLTSLEDNRQFSLTVEKIGSHETYQFKGEFVRDTQPSDPDLAAHNRVRDRFGKVVSRLFGFPEDFVPSLHPSARSCHLFHCARNLSSDARPGCWPQALSPGGEMTDSVKLPDDIRPVMQNGIPATVVTCSADGIPNTTIISQVYYVDPTHVALSFQFFNKTIRNVRENPHACVALNDLEGDTQWVLDVQYDHSETEGTIFDEMDMQIEAIASATGMSGIFKLRAADIYRVKSFRRVHPLPTSSRE